MADILDKKAKGGRVGLRKGTPNPFGRKSNIQKIKKRLVQKKNQNIRMRAKNLWNR